MLGVDDIIGESDVHQEFKFLIRTTVANNLTFTTLRKDLIQ